MEKRAGKADAPMFEGRLVMVGLGSVGQAALPVLVHELGIAGPRITVLTAHVDGCEVARSLGATAKVLALEPDNFESILAPLLAPGDFLLNVSYGVSSLALIQLCRERGALYLDTCNEPWAGQHVDASLTPSERSNYALREQFLALRAQQRNGPTAIVTQGANPGLVSSFVKLALLRMAQETELEVTAPTSAGDWGRLAQRLGIRVIQCAERDWQVPMYRKRPNEFVNTWSAEAFVGEGLQPAELGWGTHEAQLPADGARHGFGSDAAIYLQRPGLATRVRSWTPLAGAYHGFLVTHAESISIADFLTLRTDGRVVYRPTVHYAYHPCDDTMLSLHELAGRDWRLQDAQRLLRDDIVRGRDELGVLLMGNPRGAYWFGSRLTVEEARRLAPSNNATTMQVVAGILGGMACAVREPQAGLLEPEQLDHERVMQAALPFLGEMAGVWTDWTPLAERSPLFGRPDAAADPWQFAHFRVE